MTIPPIAAWAIASLTAGREPDLSGRSVPDPWSAWVERLAAIPAANRAKAWRAWLDAPNFDADAITRAIIAADPKGPPPESEAAESLPPTEDVITTCFDGVLSRPVEWLWSDRVPLGKITLLAGEAKLGKSFLTMDLIARVSAGQEVPGSPGELMPRGSVVLLSAEDDPADTIKPRLEACGADLSKVHALTTIKLPSGNFGPFNLSYVPHLERAVTRFGDTLLVVIDPVPHYVGAAADDHKNAQTRQLLEPLKDLAARLRVAILLVTHLNKGSGTNSLSRVTGSGAYTALARSNWLVIKDKDDPKRRLFLSMGTNLVEDPAGLAYRIGPQSRRVEWEADPIEMTANEALEAANLGGRGMGEAMPTKAERAAEWLADQLEPGQEIPSRDIIARAEVAGFKRDAIFKAKESLGIVARKDLARNGAWLWYFPATFDSSTVRQFDSWASGEMPPDFPI